MKYNKSFIIIFKFKIISISLDIIFCFLKLEDNNNFYLMYKLGMTKEPIFFGCQPMKVV